MRHPAEAQYWAILIGTAGWATKRGRPEGRPGAGVSEQLRAITREWTKLHRIQRDWRRSRTRHRVISPSTGTLEHWSNLGARPEKRTSSAGLVAAESSHLQGLAGVLSASDMSARVDRNRHHEASASPLPGSRSEVEHHRRHQRDQRSRHHRLPIKIAPASATTANSNTRNAAARSLSITRTASRASTPRRGGRGV